MIRLRVLGESVVEVGEHRVGPEAATLFALTLYLALERDANVTRQSLIDMLWPESDAEGARHCLRQTLYKLRQLGAPLRATASHVQLPGAAVSADFLDLAAGAPIDAERLRRSGSGFGEFLPGYAPRLSPRFTEWLEERRANVQSVVRRALAGALLDLRSRHRWAEVEAVARQYLRLDPLNEEATLALAEATALTGSKAQALSMLDQYLVELGPGASDIRLPATLLRRRIAERVLERHYSAVADACFEGREESMEVLAGLLGEARAGRGQACLIWGDAGIGKTRLAAECTRAAQLQGAQVARVGCEASDVRRPLSLFVDAVPLLLNLRGALGCSPASMAYLRRLTEHDPTAPTPSEAALDADFLFARVRRSIFDLVDAVASEGTLVVVVEDVHWLDQTSWEVLRGMIDWAATRKVLFLFTSRTEHPTGIPQDAPSLRLVRHRLGAIADDAAGRLLDALCDGSERALGAELREWYVRVAEGNPLFLRELAREWVNGGGAHRLPHSLAQVIEDRIARLAPASLRLLQASVVLGSNSTFERLEHFLEYSFPVFADSLEELERSSLVDELPNGIAARHELIADTALKRLPPAATRLLHRQAGHLLEREIRGSQSPNLLWDCAKHLQEAGDETTMLELVQMCCTQLLELGLPSDAADQYARGALLCKTPERKLELLRGEADALRSAGLWRRFTAVTDSLSELRMRSRSSESSHSIDEIDRLEGQIKAGEPFAPIYLRAIACVEDPHASAIHRIEAASVAIRLADQMGSSDCASRVYAIVTSIRGTPNAPAADVAMCDLVFHSSYGSLSLAEDAAKALLDAERRKGQPLRIVRALRFAQIPLLRSGKWQSAYESVSEALAIAQKHKLPNAVTYSMDDLATLHLEADNVDQAEYWYLRALESEGIQEDAYLASSLSHLGARLAIAKGDLRNGRRRISASIDEVLVDQFARRKLMNLTTWLRLCGPDLPSSELASALSTAYRHFLQVCDFGGQDYTAATLATVLCTARENEKAYALISEYAFSRRRELGPFPKYLTTALNLAST